jgi:hypothetical protein
MDVQGQNSAPQSHKTKDRGGLKPKDSAYAMEYTKEERQ